MKMIRPSHKELTGKLTQARRALKDGHLFFANPKKNIHELNALALSGDSAELLQILSRTLSELRPEYYNGRRPPEESYEPEIAGKDLFAFSWNSAVFGTQMYIKFVVDENSLWLVSLHPDKPRGKI